MYKKPDDRIVLAIAKRDKIPFIFQVVSCEFVFMGQRVNWIVYLCNPGFSFVGFCHNQRKYAFTKHVNGPDEKTSAICVPTQPVNRYRVFIIDRKGIFGL